MDTQAITARKHLLAAMIGAAFGIGAAEQAAAAERASDAGSMLEEIVVTAEKRSESLHDVPIAISAFTGDRLERHGGEGLRDLQQLAPSLQFGESTTMPYVSIRGIGAELANIGAESGVAIAQDGIVLSSRYLFDMDLFDVERVEVLRGPQGTIAGRNATGGAINIYSRPPTDALEGGVDVRVGSYDRITVEGELSGPLGSDKLLGRVAVRSDKADGWLENTYLDEDLNEIDKLQVRASLLAKPADNLEAWLLYERSEDDALKAPQVDAGRARPDVPSLSEYFDAPMADLDELEFQADAPATRDQREERDLAILKLTWDIAPGTTLTSTTGYIDFYVQAGGDIDGTAVAAVAVPDAVVELDQFSQELTLTTDLTDKQDLILGALYLESEAEEPLDMALPLVGLPQGAFFLLANQDLESWAVYSQWRYRFTDTLRVAIGGRYTHDQKDYRETDTIFGMPMTVPETPASGSWSAFTPRIALDYTPSDDLMLFASVSRGFKSGGFNSYANPVDEFDPEYVLSYELGLKSHLFDHRLRAAVTGFYMDYTDLQQSLFGYGDTFLPRTENAASADIYGIETEFDALLTDRFRLYGTLTWLQATYGDLQSTDSLYPELGEPNPVTGLNVRDAGGNRIVRAPEWQYSLTGEYTMDLPGALNATLQLDYSWNDSVYFDFFNHPLVAQDEYGLLNCYGSVETDDGRWRVALYGRNLTDERYFTNRGVNIGTAPVPSHGGGLGMPRTYGLSVTFTL